MTTSFEDTTYWTLVQVAIRAKHDLARVGELYDLSVMQLITLCTIVPAEQVPMNRISCILGCDASNVTGIADRLVARELIERTESHEDRRVKVIQLTDKGVRLRRHVIAEITSNQPESMSNLTNDEQQQLNALLKKALSSKPKAS